MKKSLLVGVALLTAVSGSAMAADAARPMHTKAPMMEPVFSWTGWYIGVNGGWVGGTTDPTMGITGNIFFNNLNIPTVLSVGSQSFDNSGTLFGGQIGWNLQAGSFVFGIEADFDALRLNGSKTSSGIYPNNQPITFFFNQSVGDGWLATVRPRFGVLIADHLLAYATAGLAVANLKYSNSFLDTFYTPGGAGAVTINDLAYGLAAGGGVEWALGNNWSLRGEYLYVRLDSGSGNWRISSTGAGGVSATFVSAATFTENIARAAINYRFGGMY